MLFGVFFTTCFCIVLLCNIFHIYTLIIASSLYHINILRWYDKLNSNILYKVLCVLSFIPIINIIVLALLHLVMINRITRAQEVGYNRYNKRLIRKGGYV